ncbi:MAG: HAD family hydrolase [Blastocatellia bacterium]
MSSKQAIVFDLGGVLIDWNPRHMYRKIFGGDEDAMERFLSEICTGEWNAKQDAGRPLSVATEELVARHPAREDLIRAYYARWAEMVAGAIEPTVEILAALKEGGYPLYALSNWSAETYPIARARFAFFELFDHVVISGEIEMVKPDREIFDHLLEKAGRRARECVFIDDLPGNVVAAAALGFDSIHFRSPRQLREDLLHRGIPQ